MLWVLREQGLLAGLSFLGCSAGHSCQVLPFNGINAHAFTCVTGFARAASLGSFSCFVFFLIYFIFPLEAENPLLQSQCLGNLLTRGSHEFLEAQTNLECFFPWLWERGERIAMSHGSVPVIALHPAKVKLLLRWGTIPSYI